MADHEEAMTALQYGISVRQNELQHLVDILSRKAVGYMRWSNILRVTAIILAAIVALKGAFSGSQLGNGYLIDALFAILSAFIVIIVGLEAHFKFDKRSVEINTLVASAKSTVIEADGIWRETVGSVSYLDDIEVIKSARDLLKFQNKNLADIHQKAAACGVNVTLAVHNLKRTLSSNF